MKVIRTISFVSAAAILLAASIATFNEITSLVGFSNTLQAIFDDPSIVVAGFHDGLGRLGFDQAFFGLQGPKITVALLILILINAIT